MGIKVSRVRFTSALMAFGYLSVLASVGCLIVLLARSIVVDVYVKNVRDLSRLLLNEDDLSSAMRLVKRLATEEYVQQVQLSIGGKVLFSHQKNGEVPTLWKVDESISVSPYELTYSVVLPADVISMSSMAFVWVCLSLVLLRFIALLEGRKLQDSFNASVSGFAHDVRGPLSRLLRGEYDDDSSEVLDIAQVQMLSDDLLLKRKIGTAEDIELEDEIMAIYVPALKRLGLSVSVAAKASCYVRFNRGLVSRLLINFCENSLRLGATTISIEVSVADDIAILRVLDDGPGFTDEALVNVGNRPYSGHASGNGIGIFNSVDRLVKTGVGVSFYNSGRGAALELKFSKSSKALSAGTGFTVCVLVDDDKYVRNSWSRIAFQEGIEFHGFADFESFRIANDSIPKNAIVFIDSNLPDGRGELRGKQIKALGFSRVFLASEHFGGVLPDEFEASIGKNFPLHLKDRAALVT
jgi:signal transduction histidine kinase